MRHKYETRGLVLARSPLGEANTSLIIMTPELGLVRARAQGLRRPSAKLAGALTTFAESELILVRGKETWRLAGAVLSENWFARMRAARARERAARVSRLLLRLVAGEEQEVKLYPVMRGFFEALSELPEGEHEAAEVLAALRILRALGLDQGKVPGEAFAPATLDAVTKERAHYVARINHGITASGL